ncbi:MAG TPA: amino acid permease, partial [Thermofilaceae archaeon]|nr:amino acid permease [Thermofilaceae archaeon]
MLAALVASLVGYSYAELGSRKPDSGGSYAIVATSLGAPTALLTAAFQLLAYVASAAFYAWALGEYLSVIGIPLTRLTAVA